MFDELTEIPAVGVYGSAPFVGKLADSRGPRLSLTLSFALLLVGYLGIKGVYDASEGNTEPAGGGTLFTLIIFGLLSGIGSTAGYFAALNTVAKSFPNKIVSPNPDLLQHHAHPLLDAANDCDGNSCFRLRIISFCFFYDRTHDLPRKYFRFPTHTGARDSRPDGPWLVFGSPLPIPRTRSPGDDREW